MFILTEKQGSLSDKNYTAKQSIDTLQYTSITSDCSMLFTFSVKEYIYLHSIGILSTEKERATTFQLKSRFFFY